MQVVWTFVHGQYMTIPNYISSTWLLTDTCELVSKSSPEKQVFRSSILVTWTWDNNSWAICASFNFNCQQKHNANLRQDTDMHINHHSVQISINYILEPQWPLFLKVNHPKTRCFPTKTRVIWVPGIYIYMCSINWSMVYLKSHHPSFTPWQFGWQRLPPVAGRSSERRSWKRAKCQKSG